ncbi:hypothetical protein J4H86_08100 [Spiractinospora alimapuensis]|uniref:hypothetical protein n=1 Tax=Spiractinospora alimapuensis TaxID=2820884 RepID=UPI001F32A2F0|nr:hypothetical protein [Spiractinospora alimapuensis]QVQ53672.1 hypothetical protein J4H86_08100 [Spiractinospora alimapuensis]
MSLHLRPSGADDEHEQLRLLVEGIRERAEEATPWEPDTVGVPSIDDNALTHATDVAFYANARTEVATFTTVCLNLLALHRPRDGGGISSAPHHQPQRCGCCMARWPCPTISEMRELLLR